MTTIHEQLFEEYVRVLRQVKEEVEQWWKELLAREQVPAGGRAAALARCQRRWPYGPSAHPRVLAVYRSYYFLCAKANEEAEEQDEDFDRVDPGAFVTEWLLTPDNNDLAMFVAVLPMAPIGMDLDQGDDV